MPRPALTRRGCAERRVRRAVVAAEQAETLRGTPKLKLKPGEYPELHVMGLVSKLEQRFGTSTIEHPAILGLTAGGKPVTLVNAYEAGGTLNLLAPNHGDTILAAPRGYVGGHYREESRAKFRSLVFELSNLNNWFPPPLIDRDLETARGRLEKATLTFVPADDVRIKMPFGTLTLGYTFSATGDQRSEAHFLQRPQIVATHPRPEPLDWWLRTVVKPMRFLMSLATEEPTEVEALHLRPKVADRETSVEVVWATDHTEERADRHM